MNIRTLSYVYPMDLPAHLQDTAENLMDKYHEEAATAPENVQTLDADELQYFHDDTVGTDDPLVVELCQLLAHNRVRLAWLPFTAPDVDDITNGPQPDAS